MKNRSEERLLQALFSPWRRRGASLLLVGPERLNPNFFWEAGFDVSALCSAAEALEQARDATGPKVEYFLGKAEHMPFDDGAFDYVVLAHMQDEAGSNAAQSLNSFLEEAVRCASRGVLLCENNKLSLGGFAARGLFPWQLYRMARKAAPEAVLYMRSALPLPKCCRKLKWLRVLNDALPVVPFGALLGLRMDLGPLRGAPVGVIKVKSVSAFAEGGVLNREGQG